ncbi:MAG: glycosyltransferase [Candidatus Hadarchaeales archaeon]
MRTSCREGDDAVYPVPKNPRISVIIPTLNEEKIIESTLRNVKNVLPESELIVADGKSKDRTVEIAKKYAKVCVGKGKVGAARNRGAREASGDILIFLDADTKINRFFVEEALRVMADPSVVGAGGLIMPEGVGLFTEMMFYFFNLLIQVSFLIGKPNLAGTCVAYKRKPFFEISGFNEDMVASEDFDLCKRISKKGRVVFMRKVVVKTSRRRLKKLGLGGLIVDWGRVTLNYFFGKRTEQYAAVR